MAKVHCKCGYVLSDSTDHISYKARFIADQDFYDFCDTVEQEAKVPIDACKFFGDIFQCCECNNLMIFNADYTRRCDFAPVDKEQSSKITLSYLGDKWKGYLVAIYKSGNQSKSELYWNTNKDSGCAFDMDLEELRKNYYLKFEELKLQNVLRSSFLRIEGTYEHQWQHDNFIAGKH